MNDAVKRLGRRVFNSVGKRIPNRLKWELMGLFPAPYLNIADASTEAEFLESGRQQAESIIEDVRAYDEAFDVSEATVLEIGSGPGRLLVPFAERSWAAYGVDVSSKNLRDARKLAEKQGVDVTLKRSERNLPTFESEFDLVYSMFVFQHMRRRYVIRYLLDAHDRLRGGGLVYFSFANLTDEENLETLFSEGLNLTYSFRMRYYTEPEVRTYLEVAGFVDVELHDEGHQLVAIARKPA